MEYMGFLANFAFVPLEGKKILAYGKGIANAYDKELQSLKSTLGTAVENPNHPQYSKFRNLKRGKIYAGRVGNMSEDNLDITTSGGQINRVIPLVTNVNGKKTSVGIRHMTGIKTPNINEIFGATATHPKYKNYGVPAIMETMIDHASQKPDEHHVISGANKQLNRLYRQKAKNYNLPNNLEVDYNDYGDNSV